MKTNGRTLWISGLFIGLSAIFVYFEQSFLCVFKIDAANASLCIKIIAVLETMMIILSCFMLGKVCRQELLLWSVLIVMVCAAAITIIKYGYANTDFIGHYKGYFIRVVPAVLGGTLLSRKKKQIPWQTELQIIACFFALGIINVLTVGDANRLYRMYGINYQVLSYMGAVGFCLSGSVFTYYDPELNIGIFRKKGLCNILIACTVLIDFAALYFGQGRGAIVMVLFFLIYFVSKINFKAQRTWIYLMILPFAILIFTINGFIPKLTDSLLNGRAYYLLESLLNNMGEYLENSPRGKLYAAALHGFMDKPITGNGLGAVFYEAGYYSHNIITDILCEQGLLGIFMVLFITVFILKKRCADGRDFMTESVFLIFVMGMLNLCFSGYYLDSSSIWFAIGYFFTYKGAVNHAPKKRLGFVPTDYKDRGYLYADNAANRDSKQNNKHSKLIQKACEER